MTKHIIRTIVLVLFVMRLSINAQIIVGDSTSNGIIYNNINDTTISCPFRDASCPAYGQFDLNNDGSYDIKVQYGNGGGISYSTYFTYIESIGNTDFCNITTTSTGVDTLSIGDTINQNSYWHNCVPKCVLRSISSQYIPPPGSSTTSGVFLGNNKYFGFRIRGVNDTIYGWVLCNAQYSGLMIKSYAYQGSLVGIDEAKNKDLFLKLYPNPSNEGFNYVLNKNEKDVRCWLYDLSGKEIQIEFTKQSETNYFINTKRIIDGIYFIEIKSSKEIIRKKIVIQH